MKVTMTDVNSVNTLSVGDCVGHFVTFENPGLNRSLLEAK